MEEKERKRECIIIIIDINNIKIDSSSLTFLLFVGVLLVTIGVVLLLFSIEL